jgi:hypothetical protein
MVFLGLATMVILALQTSLAPLEWRRDVNIDTAESIGSCRSSIAHFEVWLAPLALVVITATTLLAYAAFKTKDVDETYTESSWVFTLLMVHTEITLIALPVLLKLHDDEPNTSYLVFTLLLLAFPASSLGFLFGPKIHAYREALYGNDQKRKRCERAGTTRVTGLTDPNLTEKEYARAPTGQAEGKKTEKND